MVCFFYRLAIIFFTIEDSTVQEKAQESGPEIKSTLLTKITNMTGKFTSYSSYWICFVLFYYDPPQNTKQEMRLHLFSYGIYDTICNIILTNIYIRLPMRYLIFHQSKDFSLLLNKILHYVT